MAGLASAARGTGRRHDGAARQQTLSEPEGEGRQAPLEHREKLVKVKKLAHMIALMGVVGPAIAQQAAQPMQRVEITGSSIKRVAKEGALPVQTNTLDTIQKAGVTSAEQLLRLVSANGTGADNMTSGNNVFGADADRTSGGA